jgi:D-3-phosphoglycerate dehydrogenase
MERAVLIPQDIREEGKAYLRERGYTVRMGSGESVNAIKADVAGCAAILIRTAALPAEILEAGTALKVVSRHGVGVDNIDVETATRLGIWVTNAPESNANSVAEHTIGLIIACARNLVRCDSELRGGNFQIRNHLIGMDLECKTLGIVGLGRIGRLVAKKASRGLDMKVIGYDPYIPQENVVPEVQRVDDWQRIFKSSDFISLHLPANSETRGIVGKEELVLMKPTAYLINAARGEIVDEAALADALREKRIAGAGLDVFEKEPPGRDNPLLLLENVVLSPHNAALTKEAMIRMATHAAQGIDEVLSGKKPTWPVNNLL